MPQPVVVRQGRTYLNENGRFLTTCVEEALTFDSWEEAAEFILNREEFEIVYRASAVAEEDQEYAMQLEDLRG